MTMCCVNRNCDRPLATFSEGRLFHFEIASISVTADDRHKRAGDEIPNRVTVQYWLCGPCSASMTLTMEPLGGLQLVPWEVAANETVATPVEQFRELLGSLQHG